MSVDKIDELLGITPVHRLSTAFNQFRYIAYAVKELQTRKEQISALARALGELLATLNRKFELCTPMEASYVKALKDFEGLLRNVTSFIQAELERTLLESLFYDESHDVSESIERFYREIGTTENAFQIPPRQHLLGAHKLARSRDAEAMHARFLTLQRSQSELRNALGINNDNVKAMRLAIERRVAGRRNETRPEQRFYSHALHYLRSVSRQDFEFHAEDWMISPFDVERGAPIGSGGFGTVHTGTWNRTEIALKYIRNSAGVVVDTNLLEKEIQESLSSAIYIYITSPKIYF
ncbi:hypothetical protein B0H16DRAFT_1631460 [Mycena metata]|uniref:Protein kinase domain-containing protein n=1 Tax=Mycena metata TaxID=1033252 RepID=A0AAD7H0T2_9AGAR|nr:hypothetical protein B0H16DRAFT_1631460 [Mycena metata]